MHFYQSYTIKVPLFRVPSPPQKTQKKHQNFVHPRNSKSENFDPKKLPRAWVQEMFVSIPPLWRLTIMANCLIIQLSLGNSSFMRFTPRNSHFLLFHMPAIMLNRLFHLPQTKSRVYSNRSFWTPRLHRFPAISVWLHGF